MNCIMRVSCDNEHSKHMDEWFLQPVKWFSTGNVGGCFMGAQLVSCRSQNGVCWIVPPNDFQVPPSWDHSAGVTRPKAPFNTLLNKTAFCNVSSAETTAKERQQWCFHPDVEENQCVPSPMCGPSQVQGDWCFKDIPADGTGCRGPHNCYGGSFQVHFSILLIGEVFLIHALYRSLILGGATGGKQVEEMLPAHRRETVAVDMEMQNLGAPLV